MYQARDIPGKTICTKLLEIYKELYKLSGSINEHSLSGKIYSCSEISTRDIQDCINDYTVALAILIA